MKRWLASVTTAALAASALAGCASDTGRTKEGRPIVAAAFYPLAWLTEEVGGPDVDVRLLTSPGTEPHDLELSISQVRDIGEAGLVLYERGFQASVDDAVDQNAQGESLDVGPVVGLEQLHGQPDPHFWQDPARMAELATKVGAELGSLDPDHAGGYRERAASVVEELTGLDRDYAEGLGSCARHTIVVSHEAFGYLAKYHLDVRGILGLSPDAEPTPAAISQLEAVIRSDGITVVFGETLASRATAEVLAREAGVRVEVLDPIEGLSDDTAGENYLSLMRSNLAKLEEANGC